MPATICLIDDDEDEQYLFKDAIVTFDGSVEVIASAHPKKIFDKIISGEMQTPVAIFLDLNMPVMTGWDCITYMKNHSELRNIPIIVYTTSFLEEDKLRAFEMGAKGFITKPYTFGDLCAVIKNEILKLNLAYY